MIKQLYNRLKHASGIYPFFLILLPLFFIYSGYNELFGFLSFSFLLLNFSVILICLTAIYLPAYFSFRSTSKAAVFTFFVSLLFLTFGYLHDSIKQLSPSGLITHFTVLIPLLLLLFLVVWLLIRRYKKGLTDLYTFLNLLLVVLILSEIPNSIKRYQLDKSVHNLIDFRFNAFNSYNPAPVVEDSLKPDIYFLLFDAMASSKSVVKTTGQTIHQLDTFLQQKGFYLATDAAANYNWTIHSVSTTFNMDYLPAWIAPVMNDLKVYFWGSASIKDNSLFRILQKEGYAIKSYQPISFNNAQWPGNSFFANLKKNHYLFKTLPGRVYRDVFWNYTKINNNWIKKRQLQIIQDRILEKKKDFDTTVALVKNSCSINGQPKFIYGHFMIPHDPYIFDSTGNLKLPEATIVKSEKEELNSYYNQLSYTIKVIEDLVTYIQQHNKKNSIIIIAGDHGFKTEDARVKGYTFNNYSAFYFPGRQYKSLYPSVSPVNTFRIVLNEHFHAGLPLLKDSSTLVSTAKEGIKKQEKIQPAASTR